MATSLSGSITFLGPDLQEELASIDLLRVGIMSLETAGSDASKEAAPQFDAELYVEEMRFNYMVKEE